MPLSASRYPWAHEPRQADTSGSLHQTLAHASEAKALVEGVSVCGGKVDRSLLGRSAIEPLAYELLAEPTSASLRQPEDIGQYARLTPSEMTRAKPSCRP